MHLIKGRLLHSRCDVKPCMCRERISFKLRCFYLLRWLSVLMRLTIASSSLHINLSGEWDNQLAREPGWEDHQNECPYPATRPHHRLLSRPPYQEEPGQLKA